MDDVYNSSGPWSSLDQLSRIAGNNGRVSIRKYFFLGTFLCCHNSPFMSQTVEQHQLAASRKGLRSNLSYRLMKNAETMDKSFLSEGYGESV